MTHFRMRQSAVLTVAIGALLAAGSATAQQSPEATAVPQAGVAVEPTASDAAPAAETRKRRKPVSRTLTPTQPDDDERRADQPAPATKTQAPALFPLAERKPPEAPSFRKGSALGKAMELYNGGQPAEARAAAEQILADTKAGAYERAYAAQLAAHAAYGAGDLAAAAGFYQQVIALDALDNNSHYGAMLNLALLQHRQKQYAESIATFDALMAQTRSADPEQLIMKGQALFALGRYPEAAASIKQAIDASPSPDPKWQALLMQAHMKDGNPADGLRLAQQVAAASPADQQAQINLAVAYQQNGSLDKAAAVLEKLREAGQLTDPSGYELLYVAYVKLDGQQQAIAVINEGLQKGILQPRFQPLVALAQSYYLSDQIGPAIDAYQRAAPLDDDGETYLNLANLLWQENRIPEARAAAQQALAKGVKQPDRAKTIIALPGA